jgi:hypothetical protein
MVDENDCAAPTLDWIPTETSKPVDPYFPQANPTKPSESQPLGPMGSPMYDPEAAHLSKEELLERLCTSWYWTGYYAGLYSSRAK